MDSQVQSVLAELVSQGKITQETVDQIVKDLPTPKEMEIATTLHDLLCSGTHMPLEQGAVQTCDFYGDTIWSTGDRAKWIKREREIEKEICTGAGDRLEDFLEAVKPVIVSIEALGVGGKKILALYIRAHHDHTSVT